MQAFQVGSLFQKISADSSRKLKAWYKSSMTAVFWPLFWAVTFSPSFIFILRWIKPVTMQDVKMRWLSGNNPDNFLLPFHPACFILHTLPVCIYMPLLCLFWWGKIALSDKLLTVSLLRNPPLMYSEVCLYYFFYKYF